MGIGLSMTLSVSQALTLREVMTATLDHSLMVRQKIMIMLELYLKREDELKKLYTKALGRGDVKLYQGHGLKFEYAMVNKGEVPSHILQECGSAFSHVLYNGLEAFFFGRKYAMARGSWLLFVVRDYYLHTPPVFLEYWAVHERGEQVTLGNHNLATKLEFSIAAKEKKIRHYIQWLEENSPDHLANVFAYQMHLELPDDQDFQKLLQLSLQTEEVRLIRQYIDEFEWPYSLLQKLTTYDKNNTAITQSLRKVQNSICYYIENSGGDLEQTLTHIQKLMAVNFQNMSSLRKYLSDIRQAQTWQECLSQISSKMSKKLSHQSDLINEIDEKHPGSKAAYVEMLVKLGLERESLPKQGVFDQDLSQAFDFALSQK